LVNDDEEISSMFSVDRKPRPSSAHSPALKPASQHPGKTPPLNPLWFRQATASGPQPDTGAAVHAVSRGGEPLPASARARFEPRFGRDFAGVRIHRDGEAAEAARSVQARAYTWGRDIVFGRDEYQPDTPTGAWLLAHELAHVVQQDGGARRLSRQQTPGAPGDAKATAPAAPTPPKVVTLPDQTDTALGPECRADETSNPIPANSAQKDPAYLRRNLTPVEHAYVNTLEDKRVSMSLTALQKLVQLRQDIITGNPDLQLHPEGKRKESDMPKLTGDAEQDAKVRKEIQEKDFARRTAIKDLNLGSFFTKGAINWNWVGDEAAAKALEQIAQAEKLIQAQASRRLPRVVLPFLPRGTLAEKILAEQRLGFNPCFFVAKGYNDQRCWTWILMHEYFHSLGIYHGQIVISKAATYPESSPERALTDVDYLTRLVMELALGSPFTTDCHAADA